MIFSLFYKNTAPRTGLWDVKKITLTANGQLACYQSIMGKMVTFTCARNGRRGASILHVRNTVYF